MSNSNAYRYITEAKYDLAISVYTQEITSNPNIKQNYWYLGIAQLLDGKTEEAQETWMSAISDGDFDQVDRWLVELTTVIKREAECQNKKKNYQSAYLLRQHYYEINPNDLDNLFEILLLTFNLHIFQTSIIEELGIVEVLNSSQTLTQIEPQYLKERDKKLITILSGVLQHSADEPIILEFASACLPYVIDMHTGIGEILEISSKVSLSFGPIAAIPIAKLALKLDSSCYQALAHLSELYWKTDNIPKSLDVARQHRNLAAKSPIARLASDHPLLQVLLSICGYWQECSQIVEEIDELSNQISTKDTENIQLYQASSLLVSGFFSPYFRDTPRTDLEIRKHLRHVALQKLSQVYSSKIEEYQSLHKLKQKISTVHRPLRIGYLSRSLRRHSVGWLARWLFQYHDREHFQIYAYFVGYVENDPMQEWFASQVHKAYGKGKKDIPREIAEEISKDGIDILIDLDSMTSTACSTVLAFKPAPIQVTWLGWDASGQSTVDYFLADPYVLPEYAQEYYPETIWRLPHTFIAVGGFEVGVPTLRRDVLGIPNEAVIYFSSQNSYKRHPDNVRAQMRILNGVPNSYLLIKGAGEQEAIKIFFTEIAEEEGVAIDRLRFLPITISEQEHRANLSIADIVLDTYPYNGATHTLETLWMEIPIVTHVGEQFAARNSYSMMINAGITEGIAWTEQEYVEWGIRLGNNPELRQQISWKLRQSKQSSPLWNVQQFTKEVENAYVQMWEKFQSLSEDIQLNKKVEQCIDLPTVTLEAQHKNQLGIASAQQGLIDKAIAYFQAAIAIQPNYADAYYNLGITLVEKNDSQNAINSFNHAIVHNPNYANAYYNLGLTLAKQEEYGEAMDAYEKALALNPNDVDIFLAIGHLFFKQDQPLQALSHYKFALGLSPNSADALCGVGAVLSNQGRPLLAQEYFNQAIEINPDHAQSHCNLGYTFWKLDQRLEAITSLKKAIAIQPDLSEAYWHLCIILHQMKSFAPDITEAWRKYSIQYIQCCLDIDPIRSSLAYISGCVDMGLINADVIVQLNRLENYIYNNHSTITKEEVSSLYMILPFVLVHTRDKLQANALMCKTIGYLNLTKILEKEDISQSSSNLEIVTQERQKDSLLRIGFISPHFSRHPVAWCSVDTLEQLSKITPHIYFYDTGNTKQADITQKFQSISERFYRQQKTSDQESFVLDRDILIEEIRKDNLDILIDLDSITETHHANIFYHQPAPILVTWLGFDAPFLSNQNYYLCDRYTHPDYVDAHYVEQLLRLPDAHMAVSGFQSIPVNRDELRESWGIQPDQVVYLYASHSRKFNPETLVALVQILNDVPNSVLLIKSVGDMESIQNAYQQECVNKNINNERIKLIPVTETEEEYRSVYTVADVCLDSYPYNGGSQNMEALWFNLPLVTYKGDQPSSRMGYSFLATLGIDIGIATNWQEYVEWGIKLGLNNNLRNSVREQLILSKQSNNLAPLWNPQKLAKDMYNIFTNLIIQKYGVEV